jgi:hypothetical protein
MPEYSKAELKTLIEKEVDDNYEQFINEPSLPIDRSVLQTRDPEDEDIYYTFSRNQLLFFEDIVKKLEIHKSQSEDAFYEYLRIVL